MSKIRNKLIATLTIFAMLFTSLSAVMFVGSNFAKAEGDESAQVEALFQLQDGASAGYLGEAEDGKDYAGLRWATIINKAYYTSLSGDLEFGTIIAPKSYGDLDFSKISQDASGDWYMNGTDNYVSVIPNDNIATQMDSYGDNMSGQYVMYSAIRYDELDENLIKQASTELVAKAYVKITNGETVTYEYSTADTVRSLRNSVAYNLAAGNFSEADAASLKKFAVAEDKTYAKLDGEVLYSVNNEAYRETTVTFDALQGKDAEFALNSKSIDVDYNKETGVITLGADFFADLKQGAYYLTAFCEDGNVYYAEILYATTISTADDLLMFRLVDSESAGVNSTSYTTYTDTIAMGNTFDGYYVLTNNIDASKMSGRLYSWAPDDYNSCLIYVDEAVYSKGLTGTFDGRGYAISNLTLYRGGLFGVINGTVKNVAFNNFTHAKYGDRRLYGSNTLGYWATETAVFENIAIYCDNNSMEYGFVNHLSMESKLTNCYIECIYSLPKIDGTKDSNFNGYATRHVTSFLDNAVNTIFVSKYRFCGASRATSYDVKDATSGDETGGTSYYIGYSDLTKAETYASAPTVKRYIDIEDLTTRYAMGDDDTLAIDKKVTTTNNVVDSFDGLSSFVVIDGRICWASLSQVYLNSELLSVSELELNVGESFEISVKNMLDVATPDFEIISSSDAVSISNGTITAVKPGEPTLSVISKDIVLAKLIINVPKYVVNNTNTIIVDANGEAFTAPDGYLADKISVNAEGVTASLVDGVLTLEGAEVTTANGSVTPTEYTITIETLDTIYTYKVKYITAYIKDADDFVSIFALAKGDLTTAESTEQLATFDGYYMLANNIDFAGKTMPTETYTYTGRTYYSDGVMNIGLTGTFDGDGYAIYNLSAPRGGIFGAISGTLQNVAFINCNINSTENYHTGFLANMIYSTSKINNIYVSLNDTYSVYKHIASTYMTYTACFVGCYFEADLSFLLSPITTSNGYHAGALSNEDYATILVSRQMIGSRNEYGTANGIEGNSAGTTPNRPYYGNTIAKETGIENVSNRYPRKNRITGAFYRYEDREDLLVRYNGTDTTDTKAETRAANVKALFAKFDTNLFDVGEGRIAWKNDLTAYSILYNNNKVVDDIISVPSDGDKEITLSVKNGLGDVLENNDLTYVLDCKDGSVTLTGAVLTINKAGEATVTIKMGDKVIRVVTIDVYKPIIDRTGEGTIILDSFGEEIAGIDKVYDASVEGGEATVVDGNKVALSFENEAEAADKDYVVSIETETNTILYKAHYYTSYISTPEEFVETFSFGSDDNVEETIDAVTNLPIFNGYYLLANDIDFADKQMPVDSFTQVGTSSAIVNALYATDVAGNYGLTGTFDGNGYSIKNLKVTRGGIFGVVNGTVKNVALIDISSQITSANNGLIAGHIYNSGALNNVYLTYSGTSNANVAIIAPNVGYNFNMTNCYFKGEIHLIHATVNGTTWNYSAAPNKSTNSAIVISSYAMGARGGNFNQGSGNWMDGTTAGSTPVETKIFASFSSGYLGGVASKRYGGSVYRYVSDAELSSIYVDAKTVKNWTWFAEDGVTKTTTLRTINEEVTGLTTKQTALTTLLNNWDKTYFDVVYTKADAEDPEKVTNVSISWKVKTAE